jgi:hypothetical protein
MRVSGAIWRL